MSENMRIYNRVKDTPKEAQKEITAGRLKGFTDINPMWRIKMLTELFGPCGVGWKYDISNYKISDGSNGEKVAFLEIMLYYKENGEWSEPVPGIGGSMFVAQERNGMHTNDECFKMALSDAIGTACKALGMSEDIYFSKCRTKYSTEDDGTKMETVEDAASYVFEFGKHKGKTLGDVWKIDIDYIKWLNGFESTDPTILKAIAIINQSIKAKK